MAPTTTGPGPLTAEELTWSAGQVSVPRLDDLQELRELLSDEKP